MHSQERQAHGHSLCTKQAKQLAVCRALCKDDMQEPVRMADFQEASTRFTTHLLLVFPSQEQCKSSASHD